MKICRCHLMKEIQNAAFAAHEAALYLDGHPNDKRALAYFNMRNEKMKNAISLYEKNYGPITVNSYSGSEKWNWIDGPWPWEYEANVCEM